MTTATFVWTIVFFVALIWFVAWLSFLATRAYMIGERELEGQRREERRRLLEQLEKEFYDDDVEDVPLKRRKSAVKFVDSDYEAEAEVQAESKGRHVYDPVAHKVVFVPSE
jgi:hypothetical protein